MKNIVRALIPFVLLTLCTGFRSDDRLKFYWGEREIVYTSGVSLTEINQPNNANKLRFVIREDLIQEIDPQNTQIEIDLVRGRSSVYNYRFSNIQSHTTLKIEKIYSSLRMGDTILIQFKGVEGVLPQIIGIKIKD
ncbi:hypothetical protein SAMN04488029_1153 [Reichenbachiella faecimaris]|uniref:Uncharacterized protein n=1 Tax=Reichenbachiella faecimaris TaxID=692418 RepID=A0A1W2G8N6_REIFA|nr:hypothetical protein [Reichenbachiella faecimaris]SMD32802.1 hypothetical protein SAMN04488029_1153 [Reichenbachiella faecimaris]